MMTKLKPCPFCGSNNVKENAMGGIASVRCLDCYSDTIMQDDTWEGVRSQWNTRTNPLQWTKVPPTVEDVGKVFTVRYMTGNPNEIFAGRIAIYHDCKTKEKDLVFVIARVLSTPTVDCLVAHGAEFLGPLPE